MDIRRNAPVESPHILLLVDDDGDTLFPALAELAHRARPAYQSPLMLDSGEVAGWILDKEEQWGLIKDKLGKLYRRAKTRYGPTADGDPFLYAVGDGNHSLATAKAIWEEYKTTHAGEAGLMEHPARWALVEIENLYEPGISFEPIHRVVFDADMDELIRFLSQLPGAAAYPINGGVPKLRELIKDRTISRRRFGFISGDRSVLLETEAMGFVTLGLQPLLDRFIAQTGSSIDYIHGEEELVRLTTEQHGKDPAVGILLPPIRKDGLFDTIARSGPLPRKSFSMGEACEKRFYLECRKIF
jgi:hypothetical protein